MCNLTKLALLAVLATLPLLAHAKWTEVSSRHFVMLSEDEPEQLRVLAENLERLDQAIRRVSQLPDPEVARERRVTIYVVNRNSVETLAGRGSVGIYLGRASGSIAVALHDSKSSNRPLFHEYAHHVLQSSYPIASPFWHTEGSAEFFATAAVRTDGSVEVGLPLLERTFELGQLQYLSLPPLLETSDARLRAQPSLSYARSWLVVHYLTFDPARRGQLERYLKSLELGVGSTDAARGAFGDLAELDRNLKSYAREPFKQLTVPSSAIQVGTINLRELSAGEQAVMPYRMRSRVGVDEQQAQELLLLIRKAAAPFPSDAIAQAALAEAEFDGSNYAAAEVAADRAIAADPKLVDAYLYKGRAQIAAARRAGIIDRQRWTQVRQWFMTASRIDPEDPEPLVLLYLTFAASGQEPTENVVAGLYRARELAPQDHNLPVLAAYQYLADGKAEQARRMLTLVASDPHTGEIATRIGAVLEKLEQGGTAAALAAFSEDDLRQVIASF